MRLSREFIRLPLRFDASCLAQEVNAIPEDEWRPHPQGHPGNSALPLIAAGGDPTDDSVAGAMLPTPSLERLPYLRQVLASFQTVFGRTRLMRIEGGSSAQRHVDVSHYWADRVRVHVPIATSPEIIFECDGEELHMPAGEAWIFDTSRPHDVINPTGAQRIHLVADTVGSSAFWELVESGGEPRFVPFDASAAPRLETERVNRSAVMTPWEQSALVADLLEEAGNPELSGAVGSFLRDWRAAWALHGDGPSGRRVYAALLDGLAAQLAPLAGRVPLPNGVDAVDSVEQLLISPALGPAGAAPQRDPAPRAAPPLIIVAPPRSGTSLIFEALARAPGVFTVGGESHAVIEGIEELQPGERGWDSNRLTLVDARPEVIAALHDRFAAALRDRDGNAPAGDVPVLLLEKTPKNALRVPFLDAVFPNARFLYVHRDPRETLGSMIDAWDSGRFVTYPDLPGWTGPEWSLALTPEWRSLAGLALPEIVVAQWSRTVGTLLDDLDQVAGERWIGVDYASFVADPAGEVARICEFAGVEPPEELPAQLPLSLHTLTPPEPDKWRRHEAALAPLLPALDELAARSQAAAGHVPAPTPAPEPLRSVNTNSVPDLLGELGASVLVSTYQGGLLALLRRSGTGGLNTHFRALPMPMGIARDGDKLAVATLGGIAEYRSVPQVAERLGGDHDACFVPRSTHVTGDIRVHDIAYAGGELWIVATRFSCLATLDPDHSFVPRWTPPFITGLAAEDRCHLNGLAVQGDVVTHVTALGLSDEAEGWRERRADGGALIDVASGEAVITGLSMPHSPRWHDGKLWLLESGEGSLAIADPDAGTVETVAQLPGFTRGLAFAGRYAFVGLSQVREATTFGGLPLTARLEARQSGVWVVDIVSGELVGFVRFEGSVSEIFDICLLDGMRFPEIAELDSEATQGSFVVPQDTSAI